MHLVGIFFGGFEIDIESVDVALQLGGLGFKRLFFFFAEAGLLGAFLELFKGDAVGFLGVF